MFHYLWRDFIKLNSSRTSNGFGVNPISYTEIYAYYSLNKTDIQPWEVEVLEAFDRVVLNLYAKKSEAEQNKSKQKK